MTEQTECRWQWTKPDKVGLWWWGGERKEDPVVAVRISVISTMEDAEDKYEGWWAYIGPIPPEPLPPKRKVTQTLFLVPSGWAGQGGGKVYFEHWLSPDDTIPPGAIETVQKREVEQ